MPLPLPSPAKSAPSLNDSMAQVSVKPSGDAEHIAAESESEDEQDTAAKAPKDSERRRVQNAKFSAWLSQRAEKITKDEVQAIVENAKDETLSIRNLMAKQESNVIITTPREYQLELFERAKNQNIIAVLDTGECPQSRCCLKSLTESRLWKDTHSSPAFETCHRPGTRRQSSGQKASYLLLPLKLYPTTLSLH